MHFLPRFFVLFCLSCSLLASGIVPIPAARGESSGSSAAPLDVELFYDTLKDQGSWFNTTEYGDVWQPYTAYKSDAWRPYTDGYWSYTDAGWMFVSYEPFGWAVYHYGRWTRLKDIGWAWVPGTEWAPAWVAWRSSEPDGADAPAATPPPEAAPATGGTVSAGAGASQNYIGWAPLPPEAVDGGDYDYGPTVDADYGIDPYDYAFTDASLFGAPWIGGVIFDAGRSYDCCGRSVNITRYRYNRAGGYRGVYAGGPDFNRLRGRTAQPIREFNINRRTAARAVREELRAGRFNQVNGRTADVIAPRFSRNGVGPNGRVRFKRQGTLAKADVVPAAQRGGGQGTEAQGRARESFARQAQDSRQRNPRAAASRGGERNGPVRVAPDGGLQTGSQAPDRRAARQARQAANPSDQPNRAERRQERSSAKAARQSERRTERATSGRRVNGGEGGGRRSQAVRSSGGGRKNDGGNRHIGGGGRGGGAKKGGGGGSKQGGGGGGGGKKGGGGGGGGGKKH